MCVNIDKKLFYRNIYPKMFNCSVLKLLIYFMLINIIIHAFDKLFYYFP